MSNHRLNTPQTWPGLAGKKAEAGLISGREGRRSKGRSEPIQKIHALEAQGVAACDGISRFGPTLKFEHRFRPRHEEVHPAKKSQGFKKGNVSRTLVRIHGARHPLDVLAGFEGSIQCVQGSRIILLQDCISFQVAK